jgi:dTDP-4-dehydrorhamnose 3,5-epimerase-like enzyme
MEKNFFLIYLDKFTQNNGLLSFIQNTSILFEIKRVYFITNVKKNIIRGYHAHILTEQYMICLKGSIKVTLDDGKVSEVFLLNQTNKVLYVGKLIWRTMEWIEDDSILLVLANSIYDPQDYINVYSDFLKTINSK